MSQLPALVPASRQNAANTVAGQGQQAPKTGSDLANFAGSPLMQRTTQDVVALSKNGLDLSAKGLSSAPMRWAMRRSMRRRISSRI